MVDDACGDSAVRARGHRRRPGGVQGGYGPSSKSCGRRAAPMGPAAMRGGAAGGDEPVWQPCELEARARSGHVWPLLCGTGPDDAGRACRAAAQSGQDPGRRAAGPWVARLGPGRCWALQARAPARVSGVMALQARAPAMGCRLERRKRRGDPGGRWLGGCAAAGVSPSSSFFFFASLLRVVSCRAAVEADHGPTVGRW